MSLSVIEPLSNQELDALERYVEESVRVGGLDTSPEAMIGVSVPHMRRLLGDLRQIRSDRTAVLQESAELRELLDRERSERIEAQKKDGKQTVAALEARLLEADNEINNLRQIVRATEDETRRTLGARGDTETTLRATIDQRDAAVAELEARVKTAHSDLLRAQREVEYRDAKMKLLSDNLSIRDQEATALQREVGRGQREIARLQESLAALRSVTEADDEERAIEIRSLRTRVVEIEKEMNRAKEELIEAHAELEARASYIISLETDLEAIHRKLAGIEATHRDELAALRETLAVEYAERLQGTMATNDRLTKAVAEMEALRQRAEATVQLQDEIARLKNVVASREERIAVREDELDRVSADLESMREYIRERDELVSNLADAKAHIQEMEARLEEASLLPKERDDLQARITELATSLRDREQEIEAYREIRRQAEAQLADQQGAVELATKRAQDAALERDRAVAEARKERDEALKKIHNLDEVIRRDRIALEERQQILEESRHLRDQVTALETTISQRDSDLLRAQAQLASLEEDRAELAALKIKVASILEGTI